MGRVPDSLTTEFKTRNGRTVRDGGGIVPDITVTDDRKLNIAYYIFAQNLYFDFATEFVSKTPSIAKASDFVLSEDDFKAFTDFLVQKNFTYTSQTQKYYNELFEMAKIEGLDEVAKAEFASLKEKLLPDVRKNITDNKDEIAELLSLEIIKRYYFQKGEVEFSLRTDKALKTALEKMNDTVAMSEILKTK